MRNGKSLIVVLVVFILLLTGCKNPIDVYRKAVYDLLLPSKLNDVKADCNDIINQTDKLIAQDEIEQQLYDDLNNKIKNYKDNITNLQEQIDNIDHSNSEISDNHNMLISALEGYIQIGDQAQSVIVVEKSLDDDYKSLEEINQELMDIVLSGSSISFEYNQELNDFMNNNIENLKLFDLDVAEELLSAEEINTEDIKSFIDKSKDLFIQFQSIKTYNDTDEKVSSLLIQMYEQIIDMYNIIINNTQLIEWTNSYISFSEGVSTKLKDNEDNINNWANNIGIQFK